MDPTANDGGIVTLLRRLLTLVAAAVLVVALFFGMIVIASEVGEVVTLRTHDGERVRSTRLWVVDHAGEEWVRTGHPDKSWFREIRIDPGVELERAGVVSERTAVPVSEPSLSDAVNEAFERKYGAADWIVALSGNAADRVVVRLDPVAP